MQADKKSLRSRRNELANFFAFQRHENSWKEERRLRPEYHRKGEKMRDTLLKLYVKFQGLKASEEGQDLVEYALLVALIALVCVSGVNNVAKAVNGVFTNISSSLA
jgi:pilus assembly protein Flp/PilA